MQDIIKKEIEESLDVKKAVLLNSDLHSKLQSLSEKCIESLTNGGKIIFCGNGGSFADSQHLAAELISRLRFNRDALSSVALGTNNSNLTAIGNDYGYDQIFERELIAIGKPEDIFIPISTSGNSPNVIKAILKARDLGIYTCGLTGGSGGKMSSLCDCLIVPSFRTDKIQEVHIMFGHIICHLIESSMFINTADDK